MTGKSSKQTLKNSLPKEKFLCLPFSSDLSFSATVTYIRMVLQRLLFFRSSRFVI